MEHIDTSYLKSYQAFVRARKNYNNRHREEINERARSKYHEDPQYKERKLEVMREYARKRRAAKKAEEKVDV
jgi:hypothetical protein